MMLLGLVWLEQIFGHRRHQRARQNKRRDHREDDGLGQRHEEELGNTIQIEHGYEHDTDAQH